MLSWMMLRKLTNLSPSGMYPAYQVRVRSAVKMQARSRCTVPKLTMPYQTKLYHSVETRLEYAGEDELGSSCSQYLSLLSVVH